MAGTAGGTVLIERERELGAIRRALSATRDGDGALMLVQGAAGIGKTRLLREALALARASGTEALTARGGELESDVTYGIARQLLERRLAGASAGERERLLAGAARLAVPALGVDSTAAALQGTSIDHGLYWLVANLAEREPLMLLIDDAHWADVASLRFLVYLARRLEALPVLLVVAARPPDAGAGPSNHLIELLAGEPASVVLRVEALSEQGSTQLLSERLGSAPDPAAAHASYVSAGGNPFFLQEIAGALDEAGIAADGGAVEHIRGLAPPAVRRALLLRLGRLGTTATEVAEALSVLGADCSLPYIEAVSNRDRGEVLTALERLSGAGLVTPGERIAFSHPIVRRAIYGDLSEARRWRLHERAARALGERGAPVELIAQHLLQTEPAADPVAVATLRTVAARSLAGGDASAAARALARALREPPSPAERTELLVELGEAQVAAGDLAGAPTALREALSANPPPGLRVRAALALASAVAAGEGTELAVRMLAEHARVLDGEDALRLEVEHTMLAVWVERLSAEAQLRMREFETFAGVTPAERRGLANAALAAAYDPACSAAHAVSVARRALADEFLLAGAVSEPLLPGMASYVLVMGEDFATAEHGYESMLAAARERGLAGLYANLSILQCQTALARGELARAAAHGEATWDGCRALEETAVTQRTVAFAGSWLAEIHILRGELEAARALMRDAEAARCFERPELVWLRYGRALVRLQDGDPAGGLADAQAVGEAARSGGYEDRGMPWRLVAARAHEALGNLEASVALADEQLSLARAWGAAGGLGRALRVRGMLMEREADTLLVEAIELLRPSEARLELAGALVDRGVALRRRSLRVEARECLQEGMDLAARCEAMPLAELARSELRVLGARPRRLMHSGVEGLTATERRIAAMALDGAGNREIAQALFVTRKTVEGHLSHVYRKLDISSREELPAELGTGLERATIRAPATALSSLPAPPGDQLRGAR